MMTTKTLLSRFEAKLRVTPGCWLWIGARLQKGYGVIWVNGKNEGAHRVSYRLYVGAFPSELEIRHKCDNPQCVNPDHLEPGTAFDNAADRKNRGRQPDLAGEKHHNARLSAEQVKAIRSDPRTCRAIAPNYRVSYSLVSAIKRNERWINV